MASASAMTTKETEVSGVFYWEGSAKSKLETSSLNDEVQTYVLTQGIRLKPRLALTPLVNLTCRAI